MRADALAWPAIACLLAGTGLMLPFGHPLPVTAGALLLLAFVVLGAVALLHPGRAADLHEDRAARDGDAG